MPFSDIYPFQVPPPSPSQTKPRFSLTSDILSFRRCEKQYGAFGQDGFVPARATQAYFGSVIHQVLDLCHGHFADVKQLPTDDDIEDYFTSVENALRSHGIRPASGEVAKIAKLVLKRFNAVEGPTLYPRVRDTEFRLEAERTGYVLRGVVDVLAADASDPQDPAKMEIWDYKGSKRPGNSDPRLKDYEWQMAVYAELFKRVHGVYPRRAVLYFLNELAVEPAPAATPLRAMHTVAFSNASVANALKQFDTTAQAIMACQTARSWPDPATQPDKETCDICDLRWNCPVPKVQYKLRLPIV